MSQATTEYSLPTTEEWERVKGPSTCTAFACFWPTLLIFIAIFVWHRNNSNAEKRAVANQRRQQAVRDLKLWKKWPLDDFGDKE